MLIKKFTAKNYVDALEQVKRELGDDALIMSTRSIKPNSPLSGRSIEISNLQSFK
jgi:flagellar biosynthesis GTPase FlhF